MKLRTKILSGFLILALMLFIAGVWSVQQFTTFGKSVQKLLYDNYQSIHAARIMIESLEREDSAVLLLLSGKWKEGREIIEKADSSFQTGLKVAVNNITIPGEQEHVQKIKSTYEVYKGLWEKPIVGTNKESNLNWYFQEVHKAFQDTKAAVESLMTLNDQVMYDTASGLKNKAHRATMPGIIAILSAIIFTIIFNFFINYYVISPIIRISAGIRKYLKSGELMDVKIETKDELSSLASSVQDLLLQLKRGEATK